MYAPLNDPHFVFLVLGCAAVVTIGALVTALNRAPRADFARLQNQLEELSERVKALEMAEQRRFIKALNSPGELEEITFNGEPAGSPVITLSDKQ
jgi:hypothetical protein